MFRGERQRQICIKLGREARLRGLQAQIVIEKEPISRPSWSGEGIHSRADVQLGEGMHVLVGIFDGSLDTGKRVSLRYTGGRLFSGERAIGPILGMWLQGVHVRPSFFSRRLK